MAEDVEMVYSACVEWLDDWVESDPPTLLDEYDLMRWLETDMRSATDSFITYAFKSARARNDAVMILRALFYEYYLFNQQNYLAAIKPNIEAVTRLPALPQSNQKSAAWHAESRDMLSGHEFGSVCVGSVAERGAVIAKKCGPAMVFDDEHAESQTVFLTSEDGALSAFKWGWRYEPVARDLFERCVAEGTVFDGLGRIRHPTLPRLGASPDGLIMSGPRCGRLVEIKCPPTRPLTGSIPIRYYCQMQLQAEVCDSDAVEYVEVQFGATQQRDVTIDILAKSKKPWIGKVCVTAISAETVSSDYQYAYSPLFPATEHGYRDCLAWIPSPDVIIHESCVWHVKDWFNKTVPRNKQWFAEVGKPSYESFWAEADQARVDGRYKPRALHVDESDDESDSDVSIPGVDSTSTTAWIGVDSDGAESVSSKDSKSSADNDE